MNGPPAEDGNADRFAPRSKSAGLGTDDPEPELGGPARHSSSPDSAVIRLRSTPRAASTRRLATACLLTSLCTTSLKADDGYDLWLRYRLVTDSSRLREYRASIAALVMRGDSPIMRVAREELLAGFTGLLGAGIPVERDITRDGAVVAGTPAGSALISSLGLAGALGKVGDDGFVIRAVRIGKRPVIVIAANHDIGVLYGAYHLLRLLQTHASLDGLAITSSPRIQRRLLDHWDNLDGTVERGYAGASLWDWESLPRSVAPRYRDYARANASVGINGTVLTNVNANAMLLTPLYLAKVATLANVFRPFGIRVYLTARFNAPMEIGGLASADPLDPGVRRWWKQKCDEIYRAVPDFGGFVVKANSEGQPGPQDYGRTHADGANMLGDALAPHGGVVMWRAFVYSSEVPVDRVKQAYEEFTALDGTFRDNVMIQVKNGPLDFQPREPFHPLFGAMPRTPLVMEFQITKEYLGQDTHLAFLGPLFEEVLRAETYAQGAGSTVGRVIDGSLHGYRRTGIAGVANIGTDRNWTGSQFNQANWYAFGRIAWDHTLRASDIANEWVRMTFSNDPAVIATTVPIMLHSREAVVNYMTPLGLAHQMARGHHYGPGPWVTGGRADQTSVYYHHADTLGIGFDRTRSGSNAAEQYFSPLREALADRATVPDAYLLWFHHVGWRERMRSGRTLWDELVFRHTAGVDSVRAMRREWQSLEGKIDSARFDEVNRFLVIQEHEAKWWRDAMLLYFQTFSRLPLPAGTEAPAHPLSFYRGLRCPPDARRPRCEPVY